jgi:rRNA-processing protein FCF1
MDVLLANFDSAVDITEGVVVADDDGADQTDGPVAVNERRRRRIAWAAGVLAAHVDGFSATDGRVAITGSLAAAIDEADAAKAEEERREAARKAAAAHRPSLEELDYAAADIFEDEDGDADGVDPELDVLRERRRYLRDLLKTEAPSPAPALAAAKKSAGTVSRAAARRARTAAAYNVVPGYTTLIFDTNVLLSSLGLFSRVVEGGQWSVVVPLPVVTELDGLSKNPPPLGSEAQAAVAYLEARIRTHALCLKIQTARGNYLTDLLIRAEVLGGDAAAEEERGRTMDDMILNVATFQREHFVDRSALLGMPAPSGKAATQVLLVTFDRNLRLKARARGIDAADEREMAAILGQ